MPKVAGDGDSDQKLNCPNINMAREGSTVEMLCLMVSSYTAHTHFKLTVCLLLVLLLSLSLTFCVCNLCPAQCGKHDLKLDEGCAGRDGC